MAVNYYVKARVVPGKTGRDGWRELRPRPLLHAIVLSCGLALAGLFAALLAFGSGADGPGSAFESALIWIALLVFCGLEAWLAWEAYGKRLRWQDRRLRLTTPWRTREHDLADVASWEKERQLGTLTLRFADGTRIHASVWQAGYADFAAQVARHCGEPGE